jgi:hypothetical protein
VRVLREAKNATHRVFDPATKQLIEVPDHKTRLAAITLELAYTERDLGEMLERIRGSDEWQRLHSQQKTVQALPESASEEDIQASVELASPVSDPVDIDGGLMPASPVGYPANCDLSEKA